MMGLGKLDLELNSEKRAIGPRVVVSASSVKTQSVRTKLIIARIIDLTTVFTLSILFSYIALYSNMFGFTAIGWASSLLPKSSESLIELGVNSLGLYQTGSFLFLTPLYYIIHDWQKTGSIGMYCMGLEDYYQGQKTFGTVMKRHAFNFLATVLTLGLANVFFILLNKGPSNFGDLVTKAITLQSKDLD